MHDREPGDEFLQGCGDRCGVNQGPVESAERPSCNGPIARVAFVGEDVVNDANEGEAVAPSVGDLEDRSVEGGHPGHHQHVAGTREVDGSHPGRGGVPVGDVPGGLTVPVADLDRVSPEEDAWVEAAPRQPLDAMTTLERRAHEVVAMLGDAPPVGRERAEVGESHVRRVKAVDACAEGGDSEAYVHLMSISSQFSKLE